MESFGSSYENNAICSLNGNSRKCQKSTQVFVAEQPQNTSVGFWVGGSQGCGTNRWGLLVLCDFFLPFSDLRVQNISLKSVSVGPTPQ